MSGLILGVFVATYIGMALGRVPGLRVDRTGIALIAAALVWLFRWDRVGLNGRAIILAVTAIASLAAVFMNVNFHLANGGTHPWLIPDSGFDEGVDLDSLMPAIQLVFLGVAVYGLRAVRRERAGGSHV